MLKSNASAPCEPTQEDVRFAPTLLSVDEVAARWSVSPKTIYALIQRRQLVARKIGRNLRIPRAVVESVEQASAVPGGR